MIDIQLPLPPSTNKLWRNRNGSNRPHLSSEYQAWKQEAGWMVQASGVDRIEGEYDIHIRVAKSMQGDIDNRVKAILDLCKEFITDDDKFCQDQRISRSTHIPPGYCFVRITNSTTADDAGVVRQGAGFPLAPIPAAEGHGAASD